jgi:maleamate amidohydrolase
MSDWQRDTRLDYERKGFAGRSGYGKNPLLLVVDFINGFTDPKSPLGGNFASELNATRQLQEAFRRAGLPIAYTTIGYAPDLRDGGLFVKKVPSLAILQRGSPLTEQDARLAPRPAERIFEKQYASAFFGTDLNSHARARRRHRRHGWLHDQRLHPCLGHRFPAKWLPHHRRARSGR